MFESFKGRSENLAASELVSMTAEDATLAGLVEKLKEQMGWGKGEEGEGGQPAEFVPEPGYNSALGDVQVHLDNKGKRYSTNAIAKAVAESMDTDNLGLAELID